MAMRRVFLVDHEQKLTMIDRRSRDEQV